MCIATNGSVALPLSARDLCFCASTNGCATVPSDRLIAAAPCVPPDSTSAAIKLGLKGVLFVGAMAACQRVRGST